MYFVNYCAIVQVKGVVTILEGHQVLSTEVKVFPRVERFAIKRLKDFFSLWLSLSPPSATDTYQSYITDITENYENEA